MRTSFISSWNTQTAEISVSWSSRRGRKRRDCPRQQYGKQLPIFLMVNLLLIQPWPIYTRTRSSTEIWSQPIFLEITNDLRSEIWTFQKLLSVGALPVPKQDLLSIQPPKFGNPNSTHKNAIYGLSVFSPTSSAVWKFPSKQILLAKWWRRSKVKK